MLRVLFSTLLMALVPGASAAQETTCPPAVHQGLFDLTQKARAGTAEFAVMGDTANAAVTACPADRAVLGQIMAMFTAGGLSVEPPHDARFSAHVHAYRASTRVTATGAAKFEPIALTGPDGAPTTWTMLDERNAYWDLMFAMSGDFLVYGIHPQVYTPGTLEQLGCGLYPAEEAAALSHHAIGNVDGGELLARISYLGRQCDDDAHGIADYAAAYFAEHFKARRDDPDYVGLTGGDIRAGLAYYLPIHLDGASESALFDAATVAELLAF